jgi:S-adenosylmethionine decarboxylase
MSSKRIALFGVCFSLFFFAKVFSNETNCTHQFYGRHLITQYYDCDHEALCNTNMLSMAMKNATNASGAHILRSNDYNFDGNGYTMVILLSESHASIHTYPEYNACFIDLFTCGDKCSAEKFEAVLRNYLHPKRVEKEIKIRR